MRWSDTLKRVQTGGKVFVQKAKVGLSKLKAAISAERKAASKRAKPATQSKDESSMWILVIIAVIALLVLIGIGSNVEQAAQDIRNPPPAFLR